MDLYDAYQRHCDKFEILAFHDPSAKDFAELDDKLKPIIRSYWVGKPLPFPILLDSTGTTIKNYGVSHFPTTLLVDPEGKLVGEVSDWELEKKLPPLPPAERLARALDRQVGVFVDNTQLEKAIDALAKSARVEIRLDATGLKEAGVSAQTQVPLKLSGTISLRSTLDLLLDPFDLTCVPGKDCLIVTHKRPGESGPAALSVVQKHCVARIEEALSKKVRFDFKGATLEEVVVAVERLTLENFVLDPTQRRAGKLNPKTRVTGSAHDIPLREGLEKLLKPLGLTFVVRDELVVLTVAPEAGGGK
jgi:hypothetical protein